MKKVLLTTATVLALASSTAYAIEDVFYVKGQVGGDRMDKIQDLQAKTNIFFGAGTGYHIMDNVRADLTYNRYLDNEHKEAKKKLSNGKVTDGKKLKSQVDTLMFSSFVDLFNISITKIFAGAGVGASIISGEENNVQDGSIKQYKKKTNLAYALHLGVSTEFTPGVSGELTYSYKGMGKFDSTKNEKAIGPLKGHHVTTGIRFDI